MFQENADEYQAAGYSEAMLRQQFVNPLFKCLGWDMENEAGHAQAYMDVIHEAAIKIGGETKAPDYSFRIGGTPKFYLEAKKPAVNIRDDAGPAYQLRRYAWTAKMPLSILTNFAEFAVYDGRVKPAQTDKASAARILILRYTDYDQEWDQIAGVFSREAVLKGSFDKYADTNKAKRGTATVDAAFLEEIESWREELARNLALRNPQLSSRELNFAVQITIDRIIFLRMCEDRGIERYGQLRELLSQPGIYRQMLGLYRKADERYNSGLFHFHAEKGRTESPDTLTPGLDIDDKVLKAILKGLYYPDSPYEFGVLPVEILGQVYEQFLGKVISLTAGHQAKVKEKPAVKKAGGIYYTPAYIVDYIVQHTVGSLLGPPKTGLTPKQASKLRILDPACGSGSFLLGAYQYLLTWHLEYYLAAGPAKHKKEVCQTSGGEWRLSTGERKRILLDNLFGVDIDSQAVEVTKLSLLLKVLEGESQQSLDRQLKLFRERALPDLDGNIKCGNSLIAPDFYQGGQSTLFDDENRFRTNAFDWSAGFPVIMQAGGFDAVIGNPPYGADFQSEEKEYLARKFRCVAGRFDSYWYFLERGIFLLRDAGHLGVIVPDTWFTLQAAETLRRLVLTSTFIRELRVLHENVFEQVRVDVCTLIATKGPATRKTQVYIASKEHTLEDFKDGRFIRKFAIDQRLWLNSEESRLAVNLPPLAAQIIAKLHKKSVMLGSLAIVTTGPKPYQVGKGVPPQTQATLDRKPFTAAKRRNKTFRVMLRGSDISRYSFPKKDDEWLSYGEWLAEVRDRTVFDRPRLLVQSIRNPRLERRIIATYTDSTSVNNNSITNIVVTTTEISPYYVLGILNSTLMNWLFAKSYNIVNIDPRYLKKIPIRSIHQEQGKGKKSHDRMVAMVTDILSLHKQLASTKVPQDKTMLQARIASIDRQIDQLVYELYGLTEAEISIVEEATAT